MNRNYILIATCILILFSGLSNAQIISTHAGTGIAGYSGDGGQATNAQMHSPFGLAIDDDGNLFIAEKINHIIRRVSPAGIITTYAGTGISGFSGDGGPATSAQLNEPLSVALDHQGNLFFTDNVNKRIRKIDKTGIITTIAGGGLAPWPNGVPATAVEMNSPKGITVDSLGRVYYTDGCLVCRISTNGMDTILAGNGLPNYTGDGEPAKAAQLNAPTGVATDKTGNVYIGDEGNNVVRRINTSGIITTYAGNGAIGGFYGDGGPATAAGFFGPFNITTDRSGNLFIQDLYNRRIRKVNNRGIITSVAGNGIAAYTGDGGPATAASFYYPTGFAIDKQGDFYIADLWYSVIRKVTHDHTGVESIDPTAIAMMLYPNPNKGAFAIKGLFTTGTTIKILNIAGQVVYHDNVNQDAEVVLLNTALADGLYFVNLISGDDTRTLKFVVHDK